MAPENVGKVCWTEKGMSTRPGIYRPVWHVPAEEYELLYAEKERLREGIEALIEDFNGVGHSELRHVLRELINGKPGANHAK